MLPIASTREAGGKVRLRADPPRPKGSFFQLTCQRRMEASSFGQVGSYSDMFQASWELHSRFRLMLSVNLPIDAYLTTILGVASTIVWLLTLSFNLVARCPLEPLKVIPLLGPDGSSSTGSILEARSYWVKSTDCPPSLVP